MCCACDRLNVPCDKVPGVYQAAKKLKMQAAADACSRYLVANLSPTNCIGMALLLLLYCIVPVS